MDKLIFTRTGENEYRATITGSLLKLAQKESVSIPKDDGDTLINLTRAPWLTTNSEPSKGIWGSISGETFDINATYLVYYKPMSTPPHLFAVKLPI